VFDLGNGIYIGGGRFIHASRSGRGVKISSLDEPWFKRRWGGGRRLEAAALKASGGTSLSTAATSQGPG